MQDKTGINYENKNYYKIDWQVFQEKGFQLPVQSYKWNN